MLGDVTWSLKEKSPSRTELCYSAKLRPNSWGAKIMLAAFEDRYLKQSMDGIMQALDIHLKNQENINKK
jgi:hypothetical protein